MATIERFEDIEAWQKAGEVTRAIYAASNRGDFARDFGLRDQIRRAAVSVMSNIAEGFERRGDVEFKPFLSIAKGSAGEVRSQLYVALDAGFPAPQEFEDLRAKAGSTREPHRRLHALSEQELRRLDPRLATFDP